MAVIALSVPCYAPAGAGEEEKRMRVTEVNLKGLRAGAIRALAVAAAILLGCSGAWAQKNKGAKPAGTSDQSVPSMPMSPNEEIEPNIGEMLAAQQLGNMELMH